MKEVKYKVLRDFELLRWLGGDPPTHEKRVKFESGDIFYTRGEPGDQMPAFWFEKGKKGRNYGYFKLNDLIDAVEDGYAEATKE